MKTTTKKRYAKPALHVVGLAAAEGLLAGSGGTNNDGNIEGLDDISNNKGNASEDAVAKGHGNSLWDDDDEW